MQDKSDEKIASCCCKMPRSTGSGARGVELRQFPAAIDALWAADFAINDLGL